METQIMTITDVARFLGRSEGAVRASLARGASNIPPAFKLGAKWAWDRRDVLAWYEQRRVAAQGDVSLPRAGKVAA